MKKGSTIFLQAVIVLLGIGTLALLIWEPTIEGVAAHSTLFELYFNPFMACVYLGSIPYFVALYQAIKVLQYVGQNKVFTQPAVNALRTIKYCAIIIICFVVVEEIFILSDTSSDDRAGGVFMGILFTFGSIVVATAAAVLEKLLQSAVNMKSENDLTV